MEGSVKARIEQIEAAQVKRRESLAFHQSEYPGLPSPAYIEDIDFLLSLVKSQEAPETEICPVCKNEVPLDSMWSYNHVPNAFCQGCVDSGKV